MRTTATKPAPPDHSPAVRVSLSNRPGVFAILDHADWTAWIEAGRSTVLFANGNGQGREYVFHYDPSHPGTGSPVARTLTNAGPRRVMKYRNGDRTDLRRSNLYNVAGKTGGLAEVAERLAALRGPLIAWN
jgi:hypothetical protein